MSVRPQSSWGRINPTSWRTRRNWDKDTPQCLQCPAVPATERQQNPARDGILFQYRKKSIHTKNNLLHTVYLNQQSNIHRDVLHANAPRHSAIKKPPFLYIHTHINVRQYLNAKSTKWLLHLLFLTNKTLCWGEVSEVTAENTAQQETKQCQQRNTGGMWYQFNWKACAWGAT